MKEYYPEDYSEGETICDGRAAGSQRGHRWTRCDANVPSMESLVRHFLYGNHFFQKEFGVHSDEFMLPDCFGFPASLPTILAHGGIKGFSTQKLTWGSAVGIPFSIGTWAGPDGSSVVAALNPLAYVGLVTDDLSKSPVWLNRIDTTGTESGVYADYHYFGTGDKGGAPKDTSVEWLEKSLKGGGPLRVISSRADQMFDDITPAMAGRLPVTRGNWNWSNHSAGSITSEAYMKRWNRKNEQLANAAESASTAAFWLGAFPYPVGRTVSRLGSGARIANARHPARYHPCQRHTNIHGMTRVLALNQFASITERATAAVLSQLDTRAEGIPIAVYNPLADRA